MKTPTRMLMLCLLLLAFSVRAEVQKFGDVDISYQVVTTDALPPKLARAYGIARNKDSLLLMVAMTRSDENDIPKPVAADVTAHIVNLAEPQPQWIKLRNINEGEANYHIGEFHFAAPDALRFTLTVAEPGAERPYIVDFQRTFERH